MSNKIIPVEEVLNQFKEVFDLAVTQNALRSKANQTDQRLHVIIRACQNVVASPLIEKDGGERKRKLGSVVEPDYVEKSVASTKESTDYGQGGKGDTDEAFIETVKNLSVERLASTTYSKDALLLIVKKLQASGLQIEVAESDTKKILAEKIFKALNPENQTQE